MTYLTKEQFDQMVDEMFRMQREINEKIEADQSVDFELAAMDEAMELINHFDWKWWKKPSNVDPEKVKRRVQMELVDIFHFDISTRLNPNRYYIKRLLDESLIDSEFKFDNESILYFSKRYITSNFSQQFLFDLMHSCGMTFKDVYLLYIAKNVLNEFRQENGYKTGKYIKIWDKEGNEDNDYLQDAVDGIARAVSLPDLQTIRSLIKEALSSKYSDVVIRMVSLIKDWR